MPLALPTDQKHLTVLQVAHHSGISTRTVFRWIAHHGLPVAQVVPGGRVLVAVADLEQFLAKHRRTPDQLDRLVDETLQGLQITEPRRPNRSGGVR